MANKNLERSFGSSYLSRNYFFTIYIFIPRYSYFCVLDNNLDGLLAVSEAPLVISGLDSWAGKEGINVKIVKPGNAVDEEISRERVYEERRRRLLLKKENIAVYWARLCHHKGLFDIIPIAMKVAAKGYNLIIIGRFESIVEKRYSSGLVREGRMRIRI